MLITLILAKYSHLTIEVSHVHMVNGMVAIASNKGLENQKLNRPGPGGSTANWYVHCNF